MITKIPLHIFPIDQDGFHLSMKAYVNRKVANLILDTGASRTVFDLNRIGRFVKDNAFEKHESTSAGLGTNTMESHLVEFKNFKLGELILKNFTTVLLDMKHINESYEQMGLKPIDGVIGNDILQSYKAVINYQKKELKLNFQ